MYKRSLCVYTTARSFFFCYFVHSVLCTNNILNIAILISPQNYYVPSTIQWSLLGAAYSSLSISVFIPIYPANQFIVCVNNFVTRITHRVHTPDHNMNLLLWLIFSIFLCIFLENCLLYTREY